jgi:hypothetical protein
MVVRNLVAATALVGLLGITLRAAEHASERQTAAAHELRGGGTSVEQLIQELLVALEQKDESALRSLRVTEDEYRNIIVPGGVKPGEPPRELVEDWIEFGWKSLDERNRHVERAMIDKLGGKELTLRTVTFEGERQYAGYTAHRLPWLKLTDSAAEDLSIETGSIAEVGGRYKFIAFQRN